MLGLYQFFLVYSRFPGHSKNVELNSRYYKFVWGVPGGFRNDSCKCMNITTVKKKSENALDIIRYDAARPYVRQAKRTESEVRVFDKESTQVGRECPSMTRAHLDSAVAAEPEYVDLFWKSPVIRSRVPTNDEDQHFPWHWHFVTVQAHGLVTGVIKNTLVLFSLSLSLFLSLSINISFYLSISLSLLFLVLIFSELIQCKIVKRHDIFSEIFTW
jgi:hypothetical protein